MKNKEKIEKTLSSLEGLQQATAGDHFYEKLKTRLRQNQEKVINLRKDFRWQAVAAAVLILLATNIGIMYNYTGQDTSANVSDVLASEYDLLPESSYELLSEEN